MLASRILAGIIIAPAPGCSLANLAQRNLPVVAINRDYENNSGPMVYIDNRKKAYECVRHLIEVHGYRDIASVMVDLGASNVYDRYLGYCAAMAEHQLPTSLFITREYNGGQGIIRHMAEQKILPEALFIGETQAYLEVLRGLKENDISCPEDIALIGFSDSVYNAYIGPPLSALQNPGKIIAETAVRELLELIGGGTAVRKKIIIDVDIDFRESCGCGRAVR
jgi:LacI family transcriptional regulator/LacI family repressor for deo operon, udp, cdd, tsx, nupC, and nupG